jgi:hypothetical protein
LGYLHRLSENEIGPTYTCYRIERYIGSTEKNIKSREIPLKQRLIGYNGAKEKKEKMQGKCRSTFKTRALFKGI